ncbi:hypothetical protein H5079_04655 [Pseudoalteromonas sp. SG44-5]|uniref:hypothetical protein n=1 Tax=Pseudoalteromonas sp. SG44-5 TaxID=2760960 RepID=UPI0015FA5254|nr:hypothetical protein [Pseudoalteromonas sp. SG44-5]MBB1404901.1 hypothetical protein [Pseudoalteromonas sp. SG44-5]
MSPFQSQLTNAKQAQAPKIPAPHSFFGEEPVKCVTYVYGKDVQAMSQQEAIQAIRHLELYRKELDGIETSAKALKFCIEECDAALKQLAEHLDA